MGGGVRGEDVGKLLLCDPFEIPAEGLSLGVDGGGGERGGCGKATAV